MSGCRAWRGRAKPRRAPARLSSCHSKGTGAYSFWMSTREAKTDILQGTLDLMVLRTLATMGAQHGFGLAQRIQQISGGMLDLNQGTLYPALLRLEDRGWVR